MIFREQDSDSFFIRSNVVRGINPLTVFAFAYLHFTDYVV